MSVRSPVTLRRPAIAATLALLLAGMTGEARGQLVILDELLALTQGSSDDEGAGLRHETPSFGHIPGSGSERLRQLRPQHAEYHEMGLRRRLDPERYAPRAPQRLRVGGAEDDEQREADDVLARLARLRQGPGLRDQSPSLGLLDLPAFVEEGPLDGWTLEMAIERLLAANLELQADAMELPMADADVHAASRFNNPLLFHASDGMPYGRTEPERHNELSHDFTVVYPVDVTGMRRNRTELARQARSVIEAQYLDSARREIQELYLAFVNVLAARETIRFASAGVVTLDRLIAEAHRRHLDGEKPASDLEELAAIRGLTLMSVRQGQRDYVRAKRHLAGLLNLHPAEADALPIRGSIRVPTPPPPPLPWLIETAVQYRPDMEAYRLGVGHAEANVALSRSHAFKELFVFFTPITYEDRSRANELSTRGWGAGVMFEVPLFDSNRGQIRHAEYNVIRTQREVDNLARRIVTEVQDTHQDFVDSFEDLQLVEQTILPGAVRNKEAAIGRYLRGELDLDSMEQDLSSYEEIIRIYKDAMVRHRRSMLKLNTVVGCRVMP